MKCIGATSAIFLLVSAFVMNAQVQPEYFRRPYEVTIGELSRPQEGVLWTAEEDGISEWKVSGPGTLSLGDQFRMWGEVSARLEFSAQGCVTLEPVPAIVIQEPVRGVSYWVICPRSGKTKNLLQIQDANGKEYTLKTRNNSSFWGNNPWWGTSSFVMPAQATFPVTIKAFVFETDKEVIHGDALHFDFLQTFQVNPVEYPQDIVESTGDYLTTPDTMLPIPPQVQHSNCLVNDDGHYRFCYEGDDGTLLYFYTPIDGTLDDLSASFDGQAPFLPMKGGGIRARRDGVSFVHGDPDIESTLLGESVEDGILTTRWQWRKSGVSLEFTYAFAIQGRTLVVTADCDTPDVDAFECGCLKGLPAPRIFHLSYLNYRWSYPRLLVNDDVFVSLFVDWYTSNASEYGDGGSADGPQGEDGVVILNGTRYNPCIGGTKNPLHERIFLTVSPNLEDVLPNIPNPRSQFFDEMKTLVCLTRMYAVTNPEHVSTELAYEELLRDYGMKDIFLRTHYNEFRTPIHSNAFTFSLHANAEAGGDDLCRTFYDGLRKTFPRVAPYQNHRVIHPLRVPYFSHNYLVQWHSDRSFTEGWDGAYQLNPVAQRMLFREFSPKFLAKYPWNGCYLDETTNTPPWGLVDYNGHTPGAGMFRSVLLNAGSLLREMRDYYNGPIWSEGNAELFWAGCLDTGYAQTNEPDALPLVDFKIRKLNPLENLNGYDLTRAREKLNYLLSAQIVFGNIGHIWGGQECNNILGAYSPKNYTPEAFRNILKSYYMMRQLQELYAGVPVESIQYQCGEELLTATEMLRGNRQNEGKVCTRYANGLGVWVNRNPETVWKVNVDDVEYILPPYGFVASLPECFLEYSALVDGHPADYVSGPQYVYVDGHGTPTAFPELIAANAYVLLPDNQSTRLIPVPFLEAERIEGLPFTKTMPLDAKGNSAGEGIDLPVNAMGKSTLEVCPAVFQWRLE